MTAAASSSERTNRVQVLPNNVSIVRTVSGTTWHVWPGGSPVVRLSSGREIQVVEAGLDWAVHGAPELSQVYAEASEA